jgi:hypothetical protein
MEFVEGVEDFRTPEINVTGVASLERISGGQVRLTYYTRRKGENLAVVSLIWDRRDLLAVWSMWEQARESILRECADLAPCASNRLRIAH